MNCLEHADLIYEYPNAVSLELCNKLRQSILDNGTSLNSNEYRTEARNNHAYFLGRPEFKDQDTLVNTLFSRTIRQYVTENPIIRDHVYNNDFLHDMRSFYVFRFYGPEDDYNWHADLDPHCIALFSQILYFNDDYQGGELEFLMHPLTLKPKAGSILSFPSDISHIHRSRKITAGHKHIIFASFFKLPRQ